MCQKWLYNQCISYRGQMLRFHTNSTSVFLSNFRLSLSDKQKYIKKGKALTASAWIWQSHWVTSIQQSLVVSWIIAGALWVSGNESSSPKPCLNPKSSCWKQCCCTNISHCLIPIYIYIYIYGSDPCQGIAKTQKIVLIA